MLGRSTTRAAPPGRYASALCTRPSAFPAPKRRRLCPAGPSPSLAPPQSPPLPTPPLAVAAAYATTSSSNSSSSLRAPLLLPSSDRELTAALGRCESEREVALVLAAWCRQRQRGADAAAPPASATTFPINAVHAVAALTRLATLRQRRRESSNLTGGWVTKASDGEAGRRRGSDDEDDTDANANDAPSPATTAELVASLLSPALAAAAVSGALDARGAANAAWALAKLGEDEKEEDEDASAAAPASPPPYTPPPELLAALARLGPTSFAEPRHHSMALWAVARWEKKRRRRRKGQEQPLLLPAGALAAWLPRAAAALFGPSSSSSSSSSPQAVANALHAAAEIAACLDNDHDNDQDKAAARRFAAAFVESSTGSPLLSPPPPSFSPQQAACAARALALLLPSPPPAAWIASWLAATEPLLERAGPQALSLLLWSLPALLPPAPPSPDALPPPLVARALDSWLAAFSRHSEPLLPAFDDQALAVTCSAMAKVAEWRRRGDTTPATTTIGGSSGWLAALERATLERLPRLPAACLAPTLAGAVRLARLEAASSSSSSAPAQPLISARWLAAAAAASAPLMPGASDAELRAILTAVALGCGGGGGGAPLGSSSSSSSSFSPGASWRALCHRELLDRVPRMGAPREVLSVARALLALQAASVPAAADGGGEAPSPPPPASLVRAIAARLEAWLVDVGAEHASPRDVALAAWLVARLERRGRKAGQQEEEAATTTTTPPSFWAAALRAFNSSWRGANAPPQPDDASRLLWAVAVAAAGDSSTRPDERLLLPVVQAAGEGLAEAWRRQAGGATSAAPASSPLDATADALDALARLGFYPGGAWLRAFFAASASPALERAAEASCLPSSSGRRRRRRHGARRSLARIARALSALGAVDAAPGAWCASWARAWRGCGEVNVDDDHVPGPGVADLLERAAAAATSGRDEGDDDDAAAAAADETR